MAAPPQTTLAEKLSRLPDHPGVYLFRGEDGEILYVGKAVSLRNRVRSYFQSGRGLEAKTQALVALVADLEVILTDSEVEALILENNLIKRHQPKYNIRLRDDKQYPSLRLNPRDPWPRLEVVRRPADDGARYFGPYPHAAAVRETIDTLRRVFPFRSCSDRRLRQPHPCLYYHIHRCQAPCIAAVTPEAYRQMIQELEQFLDGHGERVLARLEARMRVAAEALRFEEAAEVRDRLAALRSVLEKQKVQVAGGGDRDVLAVATGAGGDAAVQVFHFQDGQLAGRDGFLLTGGEDAADGEILAAFLGQFYGGGAPVPREILLSNPVPEPDATLALLRARRGAAVRLAVPARGDKRALIDLVRRNAEEFLAAEAWRRERSRQAVTAALEELRAALGLPQLPRRIECYDNSNLQGTHPVSAMVVFIDGLPRKAEYRKFHVRDLQGPDDFATMRQVLRRRFARARAAAEGAGGAHPAGPLRGFADLPDLVIIDGGRGQLSSARAAMRELEMERIPTFGLAKENEWLFSEAGPEPIILPRGSSGLHLLQRVRDEAHRFGLGFHRQLRGQAAVRSLLDDVPGIGPRRRQALLRAFPSLEAMRLAGVDALARVPGMTRAAAQDVVRHLDQMDAALPNEQARHDRRSGPD